MSMDYLLCIFFLYAILLVFDLARVVIKKQWKAFKLSLPVYILTFVVNIMIGIGINLASPNAIIKNMIQFICKG